CADIPGATAPSFTPPVGDLGSTLRVKVVATNGVGSSAPVESAASAAIVESAPANQTLPTVTGTAQHGKILTADHGTWSGNPTSCSYQWRRCNPGDPSSCADIAGATGSSYTVVAGDVGYALEVRVTATNAGGDSVPADSALTAAVLPAAPANQTLPTVTGTAQQGKILTADHGTWSGNPTSYRYQWRRWNPGCPSSVPVHPSA